MRAAMEPEVVKLVGELEPLPPKPRRQSGADVIVLVDAGGSVIKDVQKSEQEFRTLSNEIDKAERDLKKLRGESAGLLAKLVAFGSIDPKIVSLHDSETIESTADAVENSRSS